MSKSDLERLRNENMALRTFARELSMALIKVRPLGGSELFIKRFGDYFADPVYCAELVEKQHREGIELRLELVRAQKKLSQLTPANQGGGDD